MESSGLAIVVLGKKNEGHRLGFGKCFQGGEKGCSQGRADMTMGEKMLLVLWGLARVVLGV